MAYTTPSTHPNSYVVTSTDWAIQVNNDKFFHGPPTVKVTRLASQTVGGSAWTAIAWSSKAWDSNSMFATTGTKITCKTAGKYLMVLNVGFKASTTGTVRAVGYRLNSTGTGTATESVFIPKGGPTFTEKHPGSFMFAMTTGQFVEGCIFTDGSGVGLQTSTGTDTRPTMSLLWVSS